MRYLLWLLAFSLAFPACAQKTMLRKTKPFATNTVTQAGEPAPVLVFQRTPCHGTCPTYTAAVYADGRVEYDGKRFVQRQGKHTLSMPAATLKEILAEAKRVNFSKFHEQYAGNTSDLPATIITVHPVGQPAHTVYAAENIPEDLQAFLDYLAPRFDALTSPTE